MGVSKLQIVSLLAGLTEISGFSVGHHNHPDVWKNNVSGCRPSTFEACFVSANHKRSIGTALYADTSEGSLTAVHGADDDDDEMIPSDQATTTTQFLAGLWTLIAQGNNMVKGVSFCATVV
jgi:hypothetical protein